MQVSYFLNKYAGKCVKCQTRVSTFEGICFQPQGKWVVGCRSCYPAESAGLFAARDAKNAKAKAEMAELEERRLQLIAQRKDLIEKLGLCMDSPFDVTTQQNSWNDYSEWKVPFNGDGTTDEFRKAVETSAQSLQHALRASGGVKLKQVNFEEGYVLLSECVQLCD